jgi:hypothetical protein
LALRTPLEDLDTKLEQWLEQTIAANSEDARKEIVLQKILTNAKELEASVVEIKEGDAEAPKESEDETK